MGLGKRDPTRNSTAVVKHTLATRLAQKMWRRSVIPTNRHHPLCSLATWKTSNFSRTAIHNTCWRSSNSVAGMKKSNRSIDAATREVTIIPKWQSPMRTSRLLKKNEFIGCQVLGVRCDELGLTKEKLRVERRDER